MEELRVIETTEGRQFKPWATKDDVQDPASVIAIASEIASGKQVIAQAINAKGGTASATESFAELAQDIQDTPTSGVLSTGIVQSDPFSFLDYVCKRGAYPFSEIDDDSVNVINRPYAFYQQRHLLQVRMSALATISGDSVFQECSSLQEVNLPNLTTISGDYVFKDTNNLKIVNFPKCSVISGNPIFHYGRGLVNIVFGTLTLLAPPFYASQVVNLRNITIGQDTDINLPFYSWVASNVIAEGQSGIDELNTNLYNNLLTKLYDHSEDGQTRTLRIGWLANVTAENIAYANAKGWTLTT